MLPAIQRAERRKYFGMNVPYKGRHNQYCQFKLFTIKLLPIQIILFESSNSNIFII